MKFFDAMKIFGSDKIAENYLILIKHLGIKHFEKVKFPDHEDPRIILIDDKKYNFDTEFSHNDSAETEALCAIDCLLADLGEDFKAILLTVEKALNGFSTAVIFMV